ncbi:MAG TPA: polyphenol oxidase family protein [Gemmatimonadales bacterium]|nr:polyphenol oxidase family protein [Gemmatimonadales bacterium]
MPGVPSASQPESGGESDPAIRLSGYPTLREQPVGNPSVPRVELREWAERYRVVAGITTRGRGFSLGLWSEENVGQVMTRWRAFRAAFHTAFPTVVLSHQVHGTVVQWHRQGSEGWLMLDGVDGHATSTRGVLLTITVADCVPIYLVVPQKRVVALLHAGWRGTAARILERGVELLHREAQVQPSDMVIHCGVSICGSCYEVGSEVIERLTPGRRPGVSRPAGAPGHVDLREVLVGQASELGVREVSVSPWCSAHDTDQFYSHRASGGRDGRMVAYVGLPA